MRISARNVLKGKVVEVVKGATTAHVGLEVVKAFDFMIALD